MPDSDLHSEAPRLGTRFTTTHWSVVLAAGGSGSPAADDALAQLCRDYWYPLYAFVRRRGHDATEAQDLTQEFFRRLLEKNYLAAVDRRKGRFRSFLLAAVEHFLANEWRRSRAFKRGGGERLISIDDAAEARYLAEPHTDLSPERVYQRRWAVAFLEKVLARLRAETVERGTETSFDRLKGYLAGDRAMVTYRDLAREWETTEAAVKMAVSRLRRRYAELLREELAGTVSSPDEIEDELRALLAALE